MSTKRSVGGWLPLLDAGSCSPVPCEPHKPQRSSGASFPGFCHFYLMQVESICDSQQLLIILAACFCQCSTNSVHECRHQPEGPWVMASIRVPPHPFGQFDSSACISLTIVPMCLCPRVMASSAKRGAMFESSTIAGE